MIPTEASTRARAIMAALKRRGPTGATGEVPTDSELLALADGTLSKVRRAEVLHWLVRDRLLYSRWMQMLDELRAADAAGEDTRETLPSAARRVRFRPAPWWLAGAAAAGVLAFLITPAFWRAAPAGFSSAAYREQVARTPFAQWPLVGSDRALPPRSSDTQPQPTRLLHVAFLEGLQQQWGQVPTAQPLLTLLSATVPRREQAVCMSDLARQSVPCNAGRQLGEWVARSFVLCHSSAVISSPSAAAHTERLRAIAALVTTERDLTPISRRIAALQELWSPSTRPSDGACEALAELIREVSRD